VTNEDGSPISDLLGYNIYMVAEQNRCEAVYPVAGDTTPLVCERSGTGGGGVPMYNVNGPALSFDGTDYNSSPLGETALWLNVDDQEDTMTPLPLADSEVVDPTKPVFAVLFNIEFTARAGMPTGEHKLTAYTQNTTSEIERWLDKTVRYASLTPSSRIVIHALACDRDIVSDQFINESTPLALISMMSNNKLNSDLIIDNNYIYNLEYSLFYVSVFITTAIDKVGNKSANSNISFEMQR